MPLNALRDGFPKVIYAKSPGLALSAENVSASLTKTCDESLKDALLNHGALLVRGFSVDSAEQAEALVHEINPNLQNHYLGTSPRSGLSKYFFTASGLPGFFPIAQHCEMSFIAEPPRHLFFWCQKAPREGSGETPVADFRKVYREIPEEILRPLEEKGLRITRNYRSSSSRFASPFQLKPWDHIFKTKERDEVEKQCADAGFTPIWGDGERLRLVSNQPATRIHPDTGEKVWFNHLHTFHYAGGLGEYHEIHNFRPALKHLAVKTLLRGLTRYEAWRRSPESRPMHCQYGDGSEIPEAAIRTIREAVWRNMSVTSWKTNDFLLIDNRSVSHGRLPYSGPRKIAVAWANA